MRTNLTAIALGLALVAGSAMTAGAQSSTAPNSALSEIFNTDLNINRLSTSVTYSNGFGIAVGYNPTSTLTSNSTTPTTAQSVFAGLTGVSVSAGSQFQLGVHASGRQSGGTQTIFASLFQASSNLNAASSAPLGPAIFQNVALTIPTSTVDQIYYTSTFTLNTALSNSQQYVLAFSPGPTGGATPANYVTVNTIAASRTGVPQDSTLQNFFVSDNNSGDSGTASSRFGQTTPGPLAFRVYAAAAVPEPGTVVSMLSFVGLFGGGLFLRRRRA